MTGWVNMDKWIDRWVDGWTLSIKTNLKDITPGGKCKL